MIKDYIIVSGEGFKQSDAISRLRRNVLDYIYNGFKPIGGVSMLEVNKYFYFSQAMIKE